MKPRGRLASAILTVVPLTAPASDAYFPPLAVGDSWAYAVEQGPVDKPVLTLNGVEISGKNAADEFIVSGFNPKVAGDKQIKNVLHVIAKDACVADPFVGSVLRRGERCAQAPKIDEVWSEDLKIGQRTLQLLTTFKGTEEINVGAGTFKALKFTSAGSYLNAQGQKFASIETTYWYVPEVTGMVKIDSRATTRDGAQVFNASLESFPAR